MLVMITQHFLYWTIILFLFIAAEALDAPIWTPYGPREEPCWAITFMLRGLVFPKLVIFVGRASSSLLMPPVDKRQGERINPLVWRAPLYPQALLCRASS